MKKYLVMILAVAAFVFIGCKQEKAANAEEGVNVENAIEQLQALINGEDGAALSTALEAVQQKAQEIVQSVDAETAKTYLEKVKALVTENADKIKSLVNNDAVNTVVDGIANLDVDNTVSNFLDAAKAAGVDAATDAVETGAEAVDAVKEGVENVKDAVEAAPEAVKEAAVDAAKDKANEAIDKGVSDAKKKLGL